MSNPELGGINPVDFGEPTHETWTAFNSAVERLKDLTVGIVYRGEQMLFEGEIVNRVAPTFDANAVTEYSYEQYEDPLFDRNEPTDLSFRILEADYSTLTELFGAVGDYAIVRVDYREENMEICYRKSLYDEMLHVTDNEPAVFGSPDFDEKLRAIIDSVEGARETGADQPTDGTMRQLIAVLEQEIAKRVQG